jgi:hypothetical protein
VTSAFDYDELAVQLLDDLDLERQIARFPDEIREIGAFEAANNFLSALAAVDACIRTHPNHGNPITLLGSELWASLQHAAKVLVALPEVKRWQK